MAITQDRFPLWGVFKERRRTTSRGTKSRVTVEFQTDELLFNLDEFVLGQGPAEAIATILAEQIRAIKRTVSDATIRRRQSAMRNPNSKSYRKRYAGGRIGPTPPTDSTTYGNDSGRLARSIHVRDNPTDASYTVNVAANRFDEESFGRGFIQFLQTLASLVPALGNPASLTQHPAFNKAVDEAVDVMVAKGVTEAKAAAESRRKQLEAARKAAALAAARLAGRLLGL